MRLILAIAAAAAAVAFWPAGGGAAAPPINGVWITPRGATVALGSCGGADSLCGKLVSSPAIRSDPGARDGRNGNPALRGRRLSGLTILWDFKKKGTGWSGGRVYNPEDGKTYGGSLELMPDGSLRVKGCMPSVLGINFCGLQQWKRAR
jgi:uncharacterized protein (DUF2147 family)